MYPCVSDLWSSPASAAASDLSDGTGSFFSIDKHRHLLAGKGATLTDSRYLLAEKGGISAQECHLSVGERRLHDALFFWVSPRWS